MKSSKSPATQAREAAKLREQLGYISEDQLRAFLEIKLGTFRNRQSRGELPPHCRLGHCKVYRVSDVEQWIARRRVATA